MTQFTISIVVAGGYWGILFLMALENIFPPIPSEVIMGLGGIAVAQGDMNFWLVLGFGTVGTVLGNLGWYEVGRRLGYQRLKPLVDRHGRWFTMEWEDVEKLHGHFRRRGGVTVFLFRFMPFGRTVISIPAGMLKMPFGRFLLFTAAGSAIWNTILLGAGYFLGTQYDRIQSYIGPAAIAIFAAMILWYIYRVVTWKPRSERQARG
ncbi:MULTISPECIES: DedA family protein [unclassified Sphingosinithalassobacter]|uniref:DedA family protein n=1 Tax=unclassified Sphingosinithalassobacter TaxID=2676235 RepID=UPI00165DBC08|nr:DedA family protein [Sphingosinithalassobacter sp. CS137]